MNEKIIVTLLVICSIMLFIIGMIFGIEITEKDIINTKTLGLYTQNTEINGKYYIGEWIHINVEDLNITQSLEVCKHEVGHEIFARICEENMTKCLGIK